jgi:type I restriction-modification system DNA methylase subunit
MPALGGSLFDPNRFPFLEGRAKGTHWQDTPAQPLPIDNRTVLLLLEALQVLEQRGGALLLSYKALDVEQIGHVYEGLLEHTVRRLSKDTLGLIGSQKAKNPNISLAELESAQPDGLNAMAKLVKEKTERSLSAIKNALKKEVDDATFGKIVTVCGGDMEMAGRLKPFAHLLRTDAWGDFIVYRANSFAVTLGADRRETGTHYTPKSLTESIVETTLEPVAYLGPAEGKPREKWSLKSSAELLELKICDPAMGSGAFLVQVCRWLSERLVEAWSKESDQGKYITVDGIALESAKNAEQMPDSLDEQLLIARRLVAEKCLYGVDLNPLAVELAKLSIWLITLAKGRPFGFLDHNLRSGDSLLGIHKLDQLTNLSLRPETKRRKYKFSKFEEPVREALALRKQLREINIRDIQDVQYMARLDQQARQKLEHIENIADAMIGIALASDGNEGELGAAMDNLSTWAADYIERDNETARKLIAEARKSLSIDLPAGKTPRKPFHWVLEFPEIIERGGFDGVVGNPPYHHGSRVSSVMGINYLHYLLFAIPGSLGKADLCSYFTRKSFSLLSPNRSFGLVLTNSITEGENLKASIIPIVSNEGTIYAAFTDMKWPGSASVYVTQLHIFNGQYLGVFYLNRVAVDTISSRLTDECIIEPKELKYNSSMCFKGSELLGDFYLDDREANSLLGTDKKNEKVIRRFLGGKNFTSSIEIEPDRWVIFFSDWTLEYCKLHFPILLNMLDERFFGHGGTPPKRKKWWQFHRHRSVIYESMNQLKRVLLRPYTSNMCWFEFGRNDWVISNAVVVVLSEEYSMWGLLNSSIHEEHTYRYATRMKTDLRYIPSSCFGYFPLPRKLEGLRMISEEYHSKRMLVRQKCKLNLREAYQTFHNPDVSSSQFQDLRDLHCQLDKAVAISYGWNHLDLDHDFHDTKQGIRFTISEKARREVLQRLLKLNHEQYEEEVAKGLHEKKKIKKTSTPRKKKKSTVKYDEQLLY